MALLLLDWLFDLLYGPFGENVILGDIKEKLPQRRSWCEISYSRSNIKFISVNGLEWHKKPSLQTGLELYFYFLTFLPTHVNQ